MVGTYHQFGAFVSGVASLPRVVIMTMHDISLQPVNADKDPAAAIRPNSSLELAGTVKTYRYLDEEEAAEQEKRRRDGRSEHTADGRGRTLTCACRRLSSAARSPRPGDRAGRLRARHHQHAGRAPNLEEWVAEVKAQAGAAAGSACR